MNIFRFFRVYNRFFNEWVQPVPRPLRPAEGAKAKPSSIAWRDPEFVPTHVHVRTGKPYMLTADGERLEVTENETYPLCEYQDAFGERFAQRADRFHDGRFRGLTL